MNKKIVGIMISLVAVIAITGIVLANKNSDDSHVMDSTTQSQLASRDLGEQDTHTESATNETNSIKISNYEFSPGKLTIKKGTTVTWTNNDIAEHTVTVDNGDGPKSQLFGKGKIYSYTFDTVGTYTYHCEPHPYMKGSVEVTE